MRQTMVTAVAGAAAVGRREPPARAAGGVAPLATGGVATLLVLLVRVTGGPRAQITVLAGLAEAGADPVGVMLAALGLAAELLAAYVLLALVLRLLAWLPGAPGRLAGGCARLVTVPALRRALDGLLGGAMLAQVVLAPLPARAWHAPPARSPGATVAAWPVAAARATGGYPPAVAVPTGGQGAHARPPALPPWLGLPVGAPDDRPPPPPPPRADLPAERAGRDGGRDSGGDAGADAAVGADGVRYTVAAGDSLWAVAAEHLPASTRSDGAIDAYWRRLYEANPRVVGGDPDLIHPGMRLLLPPDRGGRR